MTIQIPAAISIAREAWDGSTVILAAAFGVGRPNHGGSASRATWSLDGDRVTTDFVGKTAAVANGDGFSGILSASVVVVEGSITFIDTSLDKIGSEDGASNGVCCSETEQSCEGKCQV